MRQAQEADFSPAARKGAGGVVASAACQVWGVLNVTPDSFSDGGRHAQVEAAVVHGLAMWRAGAAVIDVGGESTRPPGATYGKGAEPVSLEEELRRVIPVVERLSAQGVRVSVDTSKAEVAARSLLAGAAIVNDVSMGASGALLEAVARAGAELVLMHNRGRGEREGANARYEDVASQCLTETLAARDRAVALGVDPAKVWLDPGLGFAKSAAASIELLSRLSAWVQTQHRVLVGASRKSFLTVLAGTPEAGPLERLAAGLVAACAAQAAGCAAVRVHDVPETLQALRAADNLARGGAS